MQKIIIHLSKMRVLNNLTISKSVGYATGLHHVHCAYIYKVDEQIFELLYVRLHIITSKNIHKTIIHKRVEKTKIKKNKKRRKTQRTKKLSFFWAYHGSTFHGEEDHPSPLFILISISSSMDWRQIGHLFD